MRAVVVSLGRTAGSLTLGGETYRVALGRSGIQNDKREGDGATPVGLLPLRQVLYRPDRVEAPLSAVPVRAVTPADGWCDDPASRDYNRMVRLPVDVSAETLWRDDPLYDIVGVLGWNDQPVVPGRGSAIFLHVATADYAPTEGCIALAPADLKQVLALGLTGIIVRSADTPPDD